MSLQFEWDSKKAQNNIKKHGISFDEACTAFKDPLSKTILDPLHSDSEERYILMGLSFRGQLLIISHTEKKSNIRIISARNATKKERKYYENNEK